MFQIDLTRYNVIDISLLVNPEKYDAERPFVMTRGLLADHSFKYDISKTHTHVGTHVEASIHFFEDGRAIDEYELSAFYGRGILLHINLPDEQKHITAEYIESVVGDIIRDGDIVVCRNENYSDVQYKKYMTEGAARYFKSKKVKMLVLGQNISMGDRIEAGRAFHDILMRDTTFLEFVDNIHKITKREFFVMALPMLVKGLDSSWSRAIVIEDR